MNKSEFGKLLAKPIKDQFLRSSLPPFIRPLKQRCLQVFDVVSGIENINEDYMQALRKKCRSCKYAVLQETNLRGCVSATYERTDI